AKPGSKSVVPGVKLTSVSMICWVTLSDSPSVTRAGSSLVASAPRPYINVSCSLVSPDPPSPFESDEHPISATVTMNKAPIRYKNGLFIFLPPHFLYYLHPLTVRRNEVFLSLLRVKMASNIMV